MAKSNDLTLLLKTNLKHLRLPTMLAEFEKLAREASAGNEDYQQYLLRLTELELATRAANALRSRIKQASFPVEKDFDTFDFSASGSLPKQKILELARGEWIDRNENVCLIGSAGTGKTHAATSLGLAACRQGRRVRFFTAATLVNRLEEAQKQYRLDRFLAGLDKADLLVCDELGYLSFSRSGAELLFQVFADRYERQLVPLLRAGYLVLCDRYIFTAFARDVVRGCSREWVRGLYNFAALPDMVFFFKANLEVSLKRILKRLRVMMFNSC